MKPKNNREAGDVIKLIVLILLVSSGFIFFSWLLSSGAEARPLAADRKTTEEPQAKKDSKIERTGLVSVVSEKIAIGQNASPVSQ